MNNIDLSTIGKKPFVYFAAPYSSNPVHNTHRVIKLATDYSHILTPFIPHLSLMWDLVVWESNVDFWYEYDLEVLTRCDALIECWREDPPSKGVTREIEFARMRDIHIIEHDDNASILYNRVREFVDAFNFETELMESGNASRSDKRLR